MTTPLHLLLIEDSDDDALLVLRELKRGGFDVAYERLETAEAMHTALEQENFDLVICDYTMPRFDGLTALKLLRQMDPDLPFILVSGTIDEHLAVTAMKGGANDYVMKQNLARLVSAVARELREAEVRRERRRAEGAQREAQAKYRAIVENMEDGLFQSTSEGRFVMANPALARILGYDSPQALMAEVTDIERQICVDPPRRAEFKRLMAEHGRVSGFEYQARRKDGHVIWISENAQATALYYEGTVRDVTERKRAEEELVKLRKAVDNSGEVIFMTDRDGLITFVNPEFTRLYGYTAAEVVGKSTPRILKSGLASPEDYAALWQTILSKQVVKGEFVNKTKDGRLLNIEGSINPVLDDDENIAGFLAIQRDITERKRAEEELRQSERSLTEAQHVGRLGSWDWDAKTDTITWSEEYYHIYGFDPTQPPPGYEEHLKAYTSESAARLDAAVKQSMQTGEAYELDLEQARPDGTRRWLTARGECRRDAHGQIVGLRGTAQDITERKRAEEDIKCQLERLAALRAIDQAITASVDLHVTLNVILDQVVTQLHVDAADVLLLSPHSQMLDYAAGRGFRTDALQHTRLRLGEGYAGRAALERQLIHIPDLRGRKTDFLRSPYFSAEGFVAYYVVPLVAKGQVKGVLEVFYRAPLDPDPEWLNFLETLAGQAAIAIDNIALFDGLQSSNAQLTSAYDATIEGWSKALDLRDKETEGHTLRVTEMALQLARAMGMSAEELVHVRRGALLHDIGKMGVPDSILLKPDKLTDEEWVIMRKHPVYAYELLSPINYLRPALDIPYCHHEKWDGTGYPRGMKGEQIPLAARLFAIVDVWDALRSDRPYRAAWPEEKVIEHLKAGSGSHFDPRVVEAFLRLQI